MSFEPKPDQSPAEESISPENALLSRFKEGLVSLVADEPDLERQKTALADAIRKKDRESVLFLSPDGSERAIRSIMDYEGQDLVSHTAQNLLDIFRDEGRFSDPIRYEMAIAKRRQESRGMVSVNGIFNYGKDEDGTAHIHMENPFSDQGAGTMLMVLNGFVNGFERFGDMVAKDQDIKTVTAISDLLINNPLYAGFFERLGFRKREVPRRNPQGRIEPGEVKDSVWAIDREDFLRNIKGIKKTKLEFLRSLREGNRG